MPEIPDAVYEAAARANLLAADDYPLKYFGTERYRQDQIAADTRALMSQRDLRATVDAVAPLLIAEGRRQAARQIIARDETEGDWDINMAYWAAVRIAEGTDA